MSAGRPVFSIPVVIILAAAITTVAAAWGPAGAEEQPASAWVALHNARARLLAGPSPDRARRSYMAGVEIELADGWKTYWRMPGDAGVPPNFDWSGSSNVRSFKVLYPAPARMHEAGSETVGYKHAVTMPVEIVPEDPSRPVGLALNLEFGVCREICIPAEAKLALTLLPSQLQGKPSPALLSALDQVPRSPADRRHDDPQVTRASAFLEGSSPHLVVVGRFPRGASSADLFIEAPDGLYVPMTQRLPRDGIGEGRAEADDAGDLVRFKVDLSRTGNAREFRGKSLRLTLVSEAGATETSWVVP